jgi:predicted unusual protein kinase regulating ubiquinone biosynthesis (AarF/ABC1/UbiB family)
MVAMSQPPPKKIKKLKSSLTSRMFSLSKLTLKAGSQVAMYGLSKAFQDPESRASQWKDLMINQTEMLTAELSQLKGSLMKAGQQLSVFGEHFFSPEINAILKQLQTQSAPLEWAPIEQTLKDNLTAAQLDALEISQEALSAASLGQVHRARITETGQEIVLKIQYPGVANAINSDLRALRTFLSVTKLLPNGPSTEMLFEEIREMLVQETDFKQEAEHLIKFAERLRDDNRFILPKVIPEFSNEKVLATAFEPSVRLDSPEVQNLSQEQRNGLAINFLDLYFKELFIFKVMQTDPHLGNYGLRLNPDGNHQIVLYDFGAVRSYPEEFMNNYYRLVAAALKRDRDLIFSASYKLRFLYHSDPQDLKEMFCEFCFDMVEPFFGLYDWKGSDLPQRLTRRLLSIKDMAALRAPPRETVFLDRKLGGVFIVLAVFRAKIDGREMINQYLKNALGQDLKTF